MTREQLARAVLDYLRLKDRQPPPAARELKQREAWLRDRCREVLADQPGPDLFADPGDER